MKTYIQHYSNPIIKTEQQIYDTWNPYVANTILVVLLLLCYWAAMPDFNWRKIWKDKHAPMIAKILCTLYVIAGTGLLIYSIYDGPTWTKESYLKEYIEHNNMKILNNP